MKVFFCNNNYIIILDKDSDDFDELLAGKLESQLTDYGSGKVLETMMRLELVGENVGNGTLCDKSSDSNIVIKINPVIYNKVLKSGGYSEHSSFGIYNGSPNPHFY